MNGARRTRRLPRALAGALAGVLLAAALGANAALPATADGQPLPSLAPMLEQVMPAVVNISARGTVTVRESPFFADPFFRRFFDVPGRMRERETQSLGSGVIVDAGNGLVITNHHVVAKADEITVTLHDGRQLAARVVGVDPDADVAVLQIPAENLAAVRLGESAGLRVGDFVVAIGNPFGLGQTVTSGIVSALGRSGLGIEGYEDFIQTDASINVGNSGGALVNLRGELIGINTAILAPGGGNVGIGFAIPVDMAMGIMSQLVQFGEIRRGLLGVATQDLTPALADAMGVPTVSGAVVVEVQEGSAAAEAGIEAGDVIVSIGERPVRRSSDVRNAVGMVRVGEEVAVEVIRDGHPRRVLATIADPRALDLDAREAHESLRGASLADIGPASPLYRRIEGVLVTQVDPDSPAWHLGLRPGDVVVGVNRRRIRSLADFVAVAKASPRALLLSIRRGSSSILLMVQ